MKDIIVLTIILAIAIYAIARDYKNDPDND